MSITLSDAELVHLQAAMRVMLSPLGHPSVSDWGAQVLQSCADLLGADQCAFALPNAGVLETQARGPYMATAAEAYSQYYWRLDHAVVVRSRQMGLEVFSRDMVHTPASKRRCVVINEWAIPNKLADPLLISFQVEGESLPALLACYHDREDGPRFGARGLTLLTLLLPAFKAGVRGVRQLHRQRASLVQLIDTLPEGIEVRDAKGQVVHRSAALLQLLQQCSCVKPLELAIGRVAAAAVHLLRGSRRAHAGALPDDRPSEDVVAEGVRYRVHASILAEGLVGPAAGIVIAVECLSRRWVCDDVLHERYRLTPRELQVGRLIAEGQSSTTIGTTLGISRHTARRHVESVLRKLNVRSRAAVREFFRA